MSVCPRPKRIVRRVYPPRTQTKTVTGGARRTEACSATTIITVITAPGTPSQSTSTTTIIQGPPGPQGPQGLPGVDGKDGWGFKWEGQWELAKEYKAQSEDNPLASVVEYMGSTYVAIQDNISNDQDVPEFEPSTSPATWALIAQAGEGSLVGEDKDFFDTLKDNIFDWWKNATLKDILQAGAIAVGIAWAGSKIVESMTDTGEGDADARFTGSNGYVTVSFVAPDIKVVLSELCEYAGIPFDVSLLPDEECQLTIGQNTSIRSILQSLALAYQFEMVDSAGVLKFVPRAVSTVKTLTEKDLNFARGSTKSQVTTKRFQGIDLPRSVTLSYLSEDTDYNSFTQVSQLPTYEEGQDVSVSVPITLTHQKAKQVTELALIQSHVERMQHKLITNLEHIDLEPGDVIETPRGNLRISKIREISDTLIEFEATDSGVAESIAASDLPVELPPASSNIPSRIGFSQAFFIDPPALSESDNRVRIYAGVHGYDAPSWPGAVIYVSDDGGSTYNSLGLVGGDQATYGLVEAITPPADFYGWDEVTTIDVTLKTGSLISVSAGQVLNGRNRAFVGKELIGFRTATLIGPKTYRLSGLLRGRRGTEQFVEDHEQNELFLLMNNAVIPLFFTQGDLNTVKKFKVVTIGSALEKVEAEDVLITSNNLRPWTVAKPRIQNLGGDFRITYKERVRYFGGLRDGSEIEHDSDWAGFGIAILNNADEIVKTYTTGSEVFTYDVTMQTADFGAPQANVKAQVVQLSRLGVPGYPVTVNSL